MTRQDKFTFFGSLIGGLVLGLTNMSFGEQGLTPEGISIAVVTCLATSVFVSTLLPHTELLGRQRRQQGGGDHDNHEPPWYPVDPWN